MNNDPSFFESHPTLKKAFIWVCFLGGLGFLASIFGADETREFARDIAVKWGVVDARPDPQPEVKP